MDKGTTVRLKTEVKGIKETLERLNRVSELVHEAQQILFSCGVSPDIIIEEVQE